MAKLKSFHEVTRSLKEVLDYSYNVNQAHKFTRGSQTSLIFSDYIAREEQAIEALKKKVGSPQNLELIEAHKQKITKLKIAQTNKQYDQLLTEVTNLVNQLGAHYTTAGIGLNPELSIYFTELHKLITSRQSTEAQLYAVLGSWRETALTDLGLIPIKISTSMSTLSSFYMDRLASKAVDLTTDGHNSMIQNRNLFGFISNFSNLNKAFLAESNGTTAIDKAKVSLKEKVHKTSWELDHTKQQLLFYGSRLSEMETPGHFGIPEISTSKLMRNFQTLMHQEIGGYLPVLKPLATIIVEYWIDTKYLLDYLSIDPTSHPAGLGSDEAIYNALKSLYKLASNNLYNLSSELTETIKTLNVIDKLRLEMLQVEDISFQPQSTHEDIDEKSSEVITFGKKARDEQKSSTTAPVHAKPSSFSDFTPTDAVTAPLSTIEDDPLQLGKSRVSGLIETLETREKTIRTAEKFFKTLGSNKNFKNSLINIKKYLPSDLQSLTSDFLNSLSTISHLDFRSALSMVSDFYGSIALARPLDHLKWSWVAFLPFIEQLDLPKPEQGFLKAAIKKLKGPQQEFLEAVKKLQWSPQEFLEIANQELGRLTPKIEALDSQIKQYYQGIRAKIEALSKNPTVDEIFLTYLSDIEKNIIPEELIPELLASVKSAVKSTSSEVLSSIHDGFNNNILHKLIQSGLVDRDLIDYLLDTVRLDINAVNAAGNSYLHSLVDSLIKYAPINSAYNPHTLTYTDHKNFMLYADIMHHLISRGLDTSIHNGNGEHFLISLFEGAESNRSVALYFEFLLSSDIVRLSYQKDAGGNYLCKGSNGESLFHIFAKNIHHIIKTEISQGSHSKFYQQILKNFIQHNDSFGWQDNDGNTVMHILAKHVLNDNLRVLSDDSGPREIFSYFDLNLKNKHNENVMQVALKHGDPASFKAMLDKVANLDLNAGDEENNSAIILASSFDFCLDKLKEYLIRSVYCPEAYLYTDITSELEEAEGIFREVGISDNAFRMIYSFLYNHNSTPEESSTPEAESSLTGVVGEVEF
jgi:hypothetical protein